MLRLACYVVFTALLLGNGSPSFADEAAPTTDPSTAVHEFSDQLQSLKKSFDELSKTIETDTKTLDSKTDIKAAEDQIATLKASVSTLLAQVADNGSVAQFGMNALSRAQAKIKSIESDPTLPTETRDYFITRWRGIETDTRTALEELQKARREFLDLLNRLQNNQHILEEMQQIGVAEKAIDTIHQLTDQIRNATRQLKSLIGEIKAPQS